MLLGISSTPALVVVESFTVTSLASFVELSDSSVGLPSSAPANSSKSIKLEFKFNFPLNLESLK